MHPSEVLFALKHFPVLYSPTFTKEPAEWCFVINDEMQGCRFVFGIGVIDSQDNPLDKIFAIPSSEFGFGDFSPFSQQDQSYARYLIKDNDIAGKVLFIAEELGIGVTP